MLHRAGDWKGVNEHIVLLSKRRAQLKQAISAMVKEAITYIDRAPDLAVKTDLIETLNTVTSGKIFTPTKTWKCVSTTMLRVQRLQNSAQLM